MDEDRTAPTGTLGQIDVIVRRAAERQALDAENRHLARTMEGRDLAEAAPGIADRLESIDLRLMRLERALNELGGNRSQN